MYGNKQIISQNKCSTVLPVNELDWVVVLSTVVKVVWHDINSFTTFSERIIMEQAIFYCDEISTLSLYLVTITTIIIEYRHAKIAINKEK